MNHVELLGTIVRNDLRYTPNGKPILDTTLAGNTGGAWYQRITNFGKIAEAYADLPVGTIIHAHGRLAQDRWEDKSGNKRSAIKVITTSSRIIQTHLLVKEGNNGEPVLEAAINRAALAGNLTRNGETKQVGPSVIAKASIAVNERRPVNGEYVEEVHFIDLAAWNDAPAFAILEAAVKGTGVTVRGTIQNRSWEGKDGTKRYATEIKVSDALVTGRADAIVADPTRLDIDDEFPAAEALPF